MPALRASSAWLRPLRLRISLAVIRPRLSDEAQDTYVSEFANALGLDHVFGVRLFLRAGLAVVAEGAVALGDGCRDALLLGELDEALRVGGIAHQPREDRAEGLGRGEPHVLVGVVDDQLHRGELGGGNR